MLEDIELPHQIVLLSDLTVMVGEVTVTDIQVIEGTLRGDIEVHQEQELLPDTEAGEVGLEACLYHAAPAIVVAAIAAAVAVAIALFAAVPRLKCQDLVPVQEMTGGSHLLGAGAPLCHNPHWIPSRPSALAKRDQSQLRDHLQEARMGGRVWSPTMMVLQILTIEAADQSKLCRVRPLSRKVIVVGLEDLKSRLEISA